MHDHAASERRRQESELQAGYKAGRREKFLRRFAEILALAETEHGSQGWWLGQIKDWASRVARDEQVRIPGFGVLDPEKGFICAGCNVALGEHICQGEELKLHCDCHARDCGAATFRRYCDADKNAKDNFDWTLSA